MIQNSLRSVLATSYASAISGST
ncbi:hypothetical protein VCHENC02_4976A, partial [Vibrio harveyi]